MIIKVMGLVVEVEDSGAVGDIAIDPKAIQPLFDRVVLEAWLVVDEQATVVAYTKTRDEWVWYDDDTVCLDAYIL